MWLENICDCWEWAVCLGMFLFGCVTEFFECWTKCFLSFMFRLLCVLLVCHFACVFVNKCQKKLLIPEVQFQFRSKCLIISFISGNFDTLSASGHFNLSENLNFSSDTRFQLLFKKSPKGDKLWFPTWTNSPPRLLLFLGLDLVSTYVDIAFWIFQTKIQHFAL